MNSHKTILRMSFIVAFDVVHGAAETACVVTQMHRKLCGCTGSRVLEVAEVSFDGGNRSRVGRLVGWCRCDTLKSK